MSEATRKVWNVLRFALSFPYVPRRKDNSLMQVAGPCGSLMDVLRSSTKDLAFYASHGYILRLPRIRFLNLSLSLVTEQLT